MYSPLPRKQTKRPQNRKMDVTISGPAGSPSSQHAYSFALGSSQDSTRGTMTGHMGVGRGRDKIPTPSARRGGEDPQPHPVPRDSEGCRTEQRLRGRVIHIYVHSLYFSRCATLTHRGISITQSSKKIIKHLLTKQQHPRY